MNILIPSNSWYYLLKTFLEFYFSFGCAGSLFLCKIFSSFGEWGLLSSCSVLVSHCGGLSCCRAQALGHAGFSSCSSLALEHRLNSCGAGAWHLGMGLNLCLLHGHVDSLPLSHQGSPWCYLYHILDATKIMICFWDICSISLIGIWSYPRNILI